MAFEETKVKAKSFAKKLGWMILIATILLSIGYYFYRTYTISEGTRAGILYKVSKKGKVFKTYEGQLQLAGAVLMNKESTFEFSAKDDQVYADLQKYEGKNVRLHYQEKVNAFPWQGDTDYLVFKVEEVK
ncbi:MAG: 6-phosphogluconate dehydrogenase [Saprospiraceae bacterium]|jgi:hypothetical protein|nr:6-phosphogluconate dehydrogenase [Saprospiraceae bacterium]